mmetsp:Transcript_4207/g.9080  ORF Transcript_4207/g.9080 Transcript_4207/m.9080 type:complete len:318 (-) Transcript_4207:224-1177(-)
MAGSASTGGVRSLSKAEQKANAARVMREKNSRQVFIECRDILKKHEDSRAHCLLFLQSNGWSLDAEGSSNSKLSVDAAARKRKGEEQKQKKQQQKEADAAKGPDAIPGGLKTLGDVSAQVLMERVCPGIHRTVLSSGNMKAMFGKGAKKTEMKESVLRHLTFFCGVSPTMSLQNGDFSTWTALCDFLKSQAEQRGRMSATTVVPIDFEKLGVYCLATVHDVKNEIVVKNRYTGEKKTFTAAELGPVDYGSLSLTQNYDELLAALTWKLSSGRMKTYRLGSWFSKQQGSKKRSAWDDSVGTPSPGGSSKKSRSSASPA